MTALVAVVILLFSLPGTAFAGDMTEPAETTAVTTTAETTVAESSAAPTETNPAPEPDVASADVPPAAGFLAAAQPAKAIAVNLTGIDFAADSGSLDGVAYTNLILAMEYNMYSVQLGWDYAFDPVADPQSRIVAGDYFTITLDPWLYLHPNADVVGNSNYLGDLVFQGEVIATPVITESAYADNASSTVITYVFTAAAEKFQHIFGSLQFNNSVKTEQPVGTLRDFTYALSGSSGSVSLRYRSYPDVPESIYQISSWFNTSILAYSVEWQPLITGPMIQAYLEVKNGAQFQFRPPTLYQPSTDVRLTNWIDTSFATFVEEAGLRIFAQKLNPVTNRYQTLSMKNVTYAQLGLSTVNGISSFAVDFAGLGFDPVQPPDVRYVIQYYLHYLENTPPQPDLTAKIPYVDASTGAQTNMATVTYKDANTGVAHRYQDPAHWHSTVSRATSGVDLQNDIVFARIDKAWAEGSAAMPAVTFRLLADGQPAYRYQNGAKTPVGDLVTNQRVYVPNLPYWNESKQPIRYTAEEVVPAGFALWSEDHAAMVFRFTNGPPFTDLAARKRVVRITDAAGRPYPDNRYHAAGDRIYYALDVDNTGTETINAITLVDALLGLDETLNLNEAPYATLAHDETMTYAAELPYVVGQADLDAGQLTNTATVSAPQDDTPAVVTATAYAAQQPDVTVSKRLRTILNTDGHAYADLAYEAVGDRLYYEFEITNSGNVTLATVTVQDPLLRVNETIDLRIAPFAPLAPGASLVYKADTPYVIAQPDLDAGMVENEVTVSTPGDATPATAVLTANGRQRPDVAAVKRIVSIDGREGEAYADGMYRNEGDRIRYRFELTNTGNVTLHSIRLQDERLRLDEAVTLAEPLVPGDVFVYAAAAPYRVTSEDMAAGAVTNTLIATVPGDSTPAVATATASLRPLTRLSLKKEVARVTASAGAVHPDVVFEKAGDRIYYRFVVRNEGHAAISTLTVRDAKLGLHETLDFSQAPLQPGDEWTYAPDVYYTVTEADVRALVIENVASVTTPHMAGSADARAIAYLAKVLSTGTTPVTPPVAPPADVPKTGESAGGYAAGAALLLLAGALLLRKGRKKRP